MKMRQYKQLLADIPDSYVCIYAADDEGNGYQEVFFRPTVGKMTEKGDFVAVDDEGYEKTVGKMVVCIN